jgi:hypothetical protein
MEQLDQYPQVVMTYMSPAWDPHDDLLDKEEEKLRAEVDHYIELHMVQRNRSLASLMSSCVIISSVNATKSARQKGTVKPEELAKRWRVSLEVAKRTIENTTQKGVRDFAHMAGTKRLQHLTHQLAYRPINAVCYTDTMFAQVPSRRKSTSVTGY